MTNQAPQDTAAAAADAAAAAAALLSTGSTTGVTGSTYVAPTVHKPATPTMGEVVQTGTSDYAAWTGGSPNSTWDALDASAPTEPTTPNQYRPMYASSAQKGYNYQRTGKTLKYKLGDDLKVFEK